MYGKNIFQAHPQYLKSLVFAIDSTQQITASPCKALIRRWHVRVRLDCDPFFTPEYAKECFDGTEVLEVEVFRSSWGIGGYNSLEGFYGVRGVKKARVYGSIGNGFAKWLERSLMSQQDKDVPPWEGLEADLKERYAFR